jgi:hypothetical protein
MMMGTKDRRPRSTTAEQQDVLYPEAGHGRVFQVRNEVAKRALEFP